MIGIVAPPDAHAEQRLEPYPLTGGSIRLSVCDHTDTDQISPLGKDRPLCAVWGLVPDYLLVGGEHVARNK